MPTMSALDTTVPEPSAPLGVLADVAAERDPDIPFLSDLPWDAYGRPVRNFGEFAAAIDDYADRLWAAGVRRGDVVAVIQRNHIEVEAQMCALGKLGALPALLSAAMEPGELLECLAKLDCPTIVTDHVGLDRLADVEHALHLLSTRVIAFADTGRDWVVRADERRSHVASPRAEDEWFVITHSSGTTGTPKLAAHSTRSLFGMVAPMIMLLRAHYGQGELSAKHLSFGHARTCAGTLAALEAGGATLSIADPDLANVKRMLLDHRPASLETHPHIFVRWEELAADPDRPLRCVQRFITTFDTIHPRTVRTLISASDDPGAHYLQAYGMTETGPISLRMVAGSDAADYSPRNVGFAGPGTEFRVVDDVGVPSPAGEPGRVETRSAGRMRSYLAGPPVIGDDGWFPMGDIGRVLPDGSLELLDRVVDHAGEYGSLLAKEDELLDLLPDLVEVVLIAGADGVFAVGCPKEGAAGDERHFLAAADQIGLHLAGVQFWTWEALPMTGTYKVRRRMLRERFAHRVRGLADGR